MSPIHPLFGRLLSAVSFKRWNGELLLVVTLSDGSPGTINAYDTGIFGESAAVVASLGVLDAAGLRELRRLVIGVGGSGAGRGGRRPGVAGGSR
jgi:hypothetical protein